MPLPPGASPQNSPVPERLLPMARTSLGPDTAIPRIPSLYPWGHKSDLRHYRQGRQQGLGVGRGIRGERQQCSPYCPLPLPDVYRSSKPW